MIPRDPFSYFVRNADVFDTETCRCHSTSGPVVPNLRSLDTRGPQLTNKNLLFTSQKTWFLYVNTFTFFMLWFGRLVAVHTPSGSCHAPSQVRSSPPPPTRTIALKRRRPGILINSLGLTDPCTTVIYG